MENPIVCVLKANEIMAKLKANIIAGEMLYHATRERDLLRRAENIAGQSHSIICMC